MLLSGISGAAAPALDEDARKKQAAQQLESTLVKQLLQSSGAFSKSSGAGSSWHNDLFVDVLADAVTKGSPLGIGKEIISATERNTSERPPPPGLAPAAAASAAPSPAASERRIAALNPTPSPLSMAAEAGTLTLARPSLDALVEAGRITSGFGTRKDPFSGEARAHRGVDVAAPEGTPIHAALPGTVVFAGERGGYGQAVEIDHGNGLRTLYAHASELHAKEGDVVEAGQTVAEVGQTGRSTGAHLHFEVRMNGQPVDPRRVLNAYGRRVEELNE